MRSSSEEFPGNIYFVQAKLSNESRVKEVKEINYISYLKNLPMLRLLSSKAQGCKDF